MSNSVNPMSGVGTCLCVYLHLDGSELSATFGLDGNAEVRTKPLEFCEIEGDADGVSTVPAHLVFALLGAGEPLFVEGGQLVSVLHPGLDLFVIPGAVPTLGYARTGREDWKFHGAHYAN